LALLVQFAGTAISYGIIATAQDLWVVMIGVAFGSVTHHASAPVLAFVADSVGKLESPKYLSISGAIGGVAIVLGSFAATGILYAGQEFRVILLVAIGLCLLALAIALLWVKEPAASVERMQRMQKDGEFKDDVEMEKVELKYVSKHHWIIFYAMFAAYFSNAGPIAVYPYLIFHMFDWGAASLSALLAAAGLCFVLAQLVVKHLSDKLGSLQLLSVISLGTISTTVFLLPLISLKALHVLIFCIFIMANSLIITSIPSQLSQETSGGKQGQIQGIGQAFQTFAGVIAPIATGALYTKIEDGGLASFGLCAIISATGTIMIGYDWFKNRHVLRKSSDVFTSNDFNEELTMTMSELAVK
jgi:DHA1 family tetracycline resistance protein-like MFS transporter